MCLSEPQTAVARTLIRTSACPGTGTGTVLTSVAEGPGAALVLTTAVMVDGSLGELSRLPVTAGRGRVPPLRFAISLPPGRRARSLRGRPPRPPPPSTRAPA